ncbi:hypothetical protein GCM10010393_31320 [Streptomyces gobitricini]|uniref:Uncharacterized protein n=1 Tax=Streptomyces gobitricini TaxID=68211 RepID=A0ABP5ZDL2_9ACTN
MTTQPIPANAATRAYFSQLSSPDGPGRDDHRLQFRYHPRPYPRRGSVVAVARNEADLAARRPRGAAPPG